MANILLNHLYKPIKRNTRLGLIKLLMQSKHDIRNSIVLTGLPRSGTTWLGEILNTIPKSAMIFEPLHIRNVPQAGKASYTWNTMFDENDKNQKALDFMLHVLQGKLINEWTARDLNIKNCISKEFIIVKFVRAENILDWLVHNFPIRKPLFLIRHPCAVVSSQLRRQLHGEINVENLLGEPVMNIFPVLREKVESLTNIEQILAAKWCLGNYYALSRKQPFNFELISYEALVLDGPDQLDKIFNALGIAEPEMALKHLKIPSITAHHGDPWESKNPIGNWQNTLNTKQIKLILNVVESFGMNFYTDELEPDYQQLYHPMLGACRT